VVELALAHSANCNFDSNLPNSLSKRRHHSLGKQPIRGDLAQGSLICLNIYLI
jgi:hypothetical protein